MVVFTTTIMELNKREDKILEIFFEEPLKQFKFKEIVERSGLHKDNVNNWLIRLQKDNLIKKIKLSGKYPYYVSNQEDPVFRNRKRLYAMIKFYETGLLNELGRIEAKAVIIFGSFSRSDWHKNSDIDIFIYGSKNSFDKAKFEKKLGREIQIISYTDKKELKKINPYLLNNITRGYYVKGSLSEAI